METRGRRDGPAPEVLEAVRGRMDWYEDLADDGRIATGSVWTHSLL